MDEKKIKFLGYSGNPTNDFKDGFAASGPFYGNFEHNWMICKQHNLPLIVSIGAKLNFLKEDQWKEVDQELVEQEITNQIFKYCELNQSGQYNSENESSKTNVFAWYVLPEELRPWRKNEMNYLKLVKNIIRKYSDKPIISYNPNNRDFSHLSIISSAGLNLVAKNAYCLFESNAHRTIIIKSLEESSKALNNLNKNKNPNAENFLNGVYLHLAMDPSNPSDDKLIEKFARHDLFLSCVCGAEMIIIWSLFKRLSVKRTYHIQYKAYVNTMHEINEIKHEIAESYLSTLAEIFLNSKKTLKHSDDLLLTHAEYILETANKKLIVDINSSNINKITEAGNELEPFDVNFRFEEN